MAITRRTFFQTGLLPATVAFHAAAHPHTMPVVKLALNTALLPRFVDPLPLLSMARPNGVKAHPQKPNEQIPFYRLPLRECHSKVHRDLPPTRFWGFGGTSPGPTIEVQSGQPILVEWANELPAKHFLPIDYALHGAGKDMPEVRGVVHVHGGRTPPESDGYPETWYVPGRSATYFYPNQQEAALLWYHDHTIGINRLNVFAGLFGLYVVRDAFEQSLALPRGKYEIPLVLCDRMFHQDGQLYYPDSGDPNAPWIPEFFGDAVLVNGKLFPYLNVEPRHYRFRIVNASNSSFYYFSLSNRQPFHQIGSDQGLLEHPVAVKTLTLAPGERADVVVDFSRQVGQQIVFRSDTLAIMQFRVGTTASSATTAVPARLRPVPRMAEGEAIRTRILSLNEDLDEAANPMRMLLNNTPWHKPVTERPVLDTVEIWSLVNVTEDSHPIHLHLVRFQILDRRSFDAFLYNTTRELRYTAEAQPPDENERGWKDTVRAEPLMVTRIIVRFEQYTGRYVWHCHVLEHEDNDMMRPYDVVAPDENHPTAPVSG